MGIETEQEKRDRLARWDAMFARMQRESFAEIERLLPKPRRQRHPRERKPDDPMTMREAAARLGCSIKTLDGHIASGALRYVNIGHGSKRERKRITPADLNAFIEAQTRKDVACPFTEPRAHLTGSSTFKSEVIAFSVQRSARPGAKRKR
jgi:excisionase family DNA binding protein